MNKRFTFMKSMITLVVILLAAFTLVACGGEDQQALVDEAKAQVALVFASGDSATSVTQDLTLPTTVGDVQITWASGNTAVISNAGVVVRQTADTNVTLTATLTLGDATATQAFALKVIAAVVVIDPLDALDDIMITGYGVVYTASTDRYTTILNINLVTSSMGLPVTWSSSNEAVISTAGVVVRPAWSTADSTVILTATIGTETKDFVVTALAITEKPAALILSEAKDALLLSDVGNGVAADLTLPTTVGNEGVTVTWTSDTPDSISDAGVVVRQPENVTVTLTATLQIGDLTDTKEFEVVVLSFAPFTDVADIAAAVALGDNSYAKIPDLTVVGVSTDGYMLFDGTTLIYVYTGGNPPAQVVEGEVFTVTGMVDYYFGVYQLSATADANMPVILVASDATAEVLTPRVVSTSISEYIATLPTTFTEQAPFVFEYITLTTKVRVQDTTNYGTFLVNTDHDGSNIDSAANSAFTDNALMIYYKSNKAAFVPYDGLDVTVNVFLYSLRTDRNIFTAIFTGQVEDIQTSLDDAGIVGVVKTALTESFDSEYTVESTVSLPTSMLGVTIAWDSASEFVNLATGLVTMPTTAGQVDVTLTGTLTRGDATDTVTITFKVGQLSVITLADVIASATSTKIRTVGVVTTSAYYRTYFIQDATGGIAIYTSDAAMLATLAANLGKEVEVFGSRAVYGGMAQISPTSITLVGEGVMPTAMNVDAVALNATDMLPYSGQLVEMTGLYVSAVATDSYGNVSVTLYRLGEGTKVTMKWDSRQALSTEAAARLAAIAVGQYLDVVNPLAWSNGPFLYFTDTTALTAATATDTDLVALDAMELVIPTEMTAAGTITLPAAGTNLSTIVWTSSNDLIIDPTTGAVVLPVAGIETITLTATLTLNAVEKVVTFDVAVGNEPVASGVLTDTVEFTGTTTTNMVEVVNNAEAVNLDPAIFSVIATKGTASALVGLNAAGQIRVYGNRVDGEGNTLSITVAAGYKITGIVFTFGASSNNPTGLLTLGATPSDLIDTQLTNTTMSYDSLDIMSFSLKNNKTGGTSNAQIYILSIVITYEEI